MNDHIEKLSKELKDYIRKYNHQSFVSQWCYLCNAHWRTQSNIVQLHSPVRQLMYLISLYHSTTFKGGNERFEAYGDEYENIVRLLNTIEDCYVYTPENLITPDHTKESLKRLFICNSTFLNYYLNASLSYFEQDVERIRQTFKHFESHIKDKIGLEIQDFIDFFFLITNLEIEIYNQYFNYNYSPEEHTLIIKMRDNPTSLTNDELLKVNYLAENGVLRLGISINELKKSMDSEKVDMILVIFTMIRNENENYLYYTDTCDYLSKPLLMTDPDHISFLYSKQLITAIYDYLFELCKKADKNGRKVLMRREDYLEDKTHEVFRNFFGKEAKIYSNYQVNGPEKDLLILKGKYAYIIECKANKYRIPFRDPIKAYDRINDDFKKSIGKGYQQAKEIEDLFNGDEPFEIKNERGKILETIYPSKFMEVFNIVVTQERFGQIQCDLSHLLEIDENDNFPWAVFIDDLETFLITLKRKCNHLCEFPAFLLEREKLHGRMLCSDELELCAYFLFDRDNFFKYCNSEDLFVSSPDVHQFFDLLYNVGFGFKNELNIKDKLKRYSPEALAVINKNKLQKPELFK